MVRCSSPEHARILPPDSSGEVDGVFVVVVSWMYCGFFYSWVLVFSCFRKIFQGLSYFFLFLFMDFIKKNIEIISCG